MTFQAGGDFTAQYKEDAAGPVSPFWASGAHLVFCGVLADNPFSVYAAFACFGCFLFRPLEGASLQTPDTLFDPRRARWNFFANPSR
ncbi:MAG: hypothetical protein ACREFR_12950 [Limisphaerales bacterium]